MALNQTNKLVWIVETIYKARKITFEELNRQWMDNVDLSGGEELLKRTFHKWKWNIFDTFGLSIECEKAAPYRYYIVVPQKAENPLILINKRSLFLSMSTVFIIFE